MTGQLGTPREGVMNIAASFPSVRNQGLSIRTGRNQTMKVMLASFFFEALNSGRASHCNFYRFSSFTSCTN
jgi:hypothetical protein